MTRIFIGFNYNGFSVARIQNSRSCKYIYTTCNCKSYQQPVTDDLSSKLDQNCMFGGDIGELHEMNK